MAGSGFLSTSHRTNGKNLERKTMYRKFGASWTAGLLTLAIVAPASAQNEQFIPVLAYRTGVYAVSGVPYVDGEVDYYTLITRETAASMVSRSFSRNAKRVTRPIEDWNATSGSRAKVQRARHLSFLDQPV
jgi:hypothetical protein